MGQHGGVTTRVFVSGYGRVLTVAGSRCGRGDHRRRGHRRTTFGPCWSPRRSAEPAGVAAWALFWRPRVEVSDGGVLVVNVTRTIEMPWPVFVAAEAGWSLVVTTTHGRWTAWAAPRASGTGAALRRGRPRRPVGRRRDRAPGASGRPPRWWPQAITQRHDALVSAGHLDGARRVAEREGIRPAVTWHVATIAGGAGAGEPGQPGCRDLTARSGPLAVRPLGLARGLRRRTRDGGGSVPALRPSSRAPSASATGSASDAGRTRRAGRRR